jgi:hypothetical protein
MPHQLHNRRYSKPQPLTATGANIFKRQNTKYPKKWINKMTWRSLRLGGSIPIVPIELLFTGLMTLVTSESGIIYFWGNTYFS